MDTVKIYVDGTNIVDVQRSWIKNYTDFITWVEKGEANFFEVKVRSQSDNRNIMILKGKISAIVHE